MMPSMILRSLISTGRAALLMGCLVGFFGLSSVSFAQQDPPPLPLQLGPDGRLQTPWMPLPQVVRSPNVPAARGLDDLFGPETETEHAPAPQSTSLPPPHSPASDAPQHDITPDQRVATRPSPPAIRPIKEAAHTAAAASASLVASAASATPDTPPPHAASSVASVASSASAEATAAASMGASSGAPSPSPPPSGWIDQVKQISPTTAVTAAAVTVAVVGIGMVMAGVTTAGGAAVAAAGTVASTAGAVGGPAGSFLQLLFSLLQKFLAKIIANPLQWVVEQVIKRTLIKFFKLEHILTPAGLWRTLRERWRSRKTSKLEQANTSAGASSPPNEV